MAEAAASASVKPDLGNDVGQNKKQISLGHSFNNNKHSIFTKRMILKKVIRKIPFGKFQRC
jgi:hypothetical protein